MNAKTKILKSITNGLLLLFIFILFISAIQQSDCIYWHKRRLLTWEDFKTVENLENDISAITNSGITIHTIDVSQEAMKCEVLTCFHKENSLYISYKKSEILLKHEQGHFDITEIFARKIRKELSSTVVNYRDIKEFVVKTYNKYKQLKKEYQNIYDLETHYSKDREKQQEWSEKIENELKSLEQYSSPIVEIKIKN